MLDYRVSTLLSAGDSSIALCYCQHHHASTTTPAPPRQHHHASTTTPAPPRQPYHADPGPGTFVPALAVPAAPVQFLVDLNNRSTTSPIFT